MLNADDFESHFSALSKDNETLSAEQLRIQSAVTERTSLLTSNKKLPFTCTECDFVECAECKNISENTVHHG